MGEAIEPDDPVVAERIAAAEAAPTDVDAQIAAAWACDSCGRENDAIGYYDTAYELGVPENIRHRFLVGYGSTLRNVGRIDDAVRVLRDAVAVYPDYAPLQAFLGLALHSSGQHAQASAAFIECALRGATELDGYERALRSYRDILLGKALATEL